MLLVDEESGVNVGHGEDELETRKAAAGPESAVNLVELGRPVRRSVSVRIGWGSHKELKSGELLVRCAESRESNRLCVIIPKSGWSREGGADLRVEDRIGDVEERTGRSSR